MYYCILVRLTQLCFSYKQCKCAMGQKQRNLFQYILMQFSNFEICINYSASDMTAGCLKVIMI